MLGASLLVNDKVMRVETHDGISDLPKGTPRRRHHPGTSFNGHWGLHLDCGHSASRSLRAKCWMVVSSWLSWHHEWTRWWLWILVSLTGGRTRETARPSISMPCVLPCPCVHRSQKRTRVLMYSECCTSWLQKVSDWWVGRLQLMPVTF